MLQLSWRSAKEVEGNHTAVAFFAEEEEEEEEEEEKEEEEVAPLRCVVVV